MKKCCFIIPYFGKLPKYFPVFLKTCQTNSKNYDWLIFTDDTENYNLPNNVKIIYMTFNNLRELIQSKFDFEISLEKPYKLCDYKPAYGYIFEEHISNYEFWGHCDLDIIVGKLDDFLTDEILSHYDKLFCLGHMVLYRNNYTNNRMFMKSYKGKFLYKNSFTTKDITIFDETHGGKDNINSIFIENNIPTYTKDLSLNFKILPTKFIRLTFNYQNYNYDIEKYKKAIYVWNDGKIYRIYKNNNLLVKEEFLYAHFQQRKMSFNKKILTSNCFKIIPNRFTLLEYEEITEENFKKIKKNGICFHYIRIHYNRKISRVKQIIKKRRIRCVK